MRSGVCGAVCRPACGAGKDPENKQSLSCEPFLRAASESPPLRTCLDAEGEDRDRRFGGTMLRALV